MRVRVYTRERMLFHDPVTGYYWLPAYTKGYLVRPSNEDRKRWIERYQDRLNERCVIVSIRGTDRLIEVRKLIAESEIERRRQELIDAGIVLDED
jgi:hypothetical protein